MIVHSVTISAAADANPQVVNSYTWTPEAPIAHLEAAVAELNRYIATAKHSQLVDPTKPSLPIAV